MMRALRHLCAVTTVVLVSCSTGHPADQCTGGTGDAGAEPRNFGEPCGDDGIACASGLTCSAVGAGDGTTVDRECLPQCDAGACEPKCTVQAECTGRFQQRCVGADGGSLTGVCRAVACASHLLPCDAGFTCVQPLFCCPAGAPCRAPPNGVCVR